MTSEPLLAALVLALCVHTVWREYRENRRRKAHAEKIDHLLTILERPLRALEQEEVGPSGEADRLPLWGNPYTGQWKRLGEEERREDTDLVD